MNREYQRPENESENAEVEDRIEGLLDRMLENESISKRNEGHNGVILTVDFNKLKPAEKLEFCQYFDIPWTNEDDELAIKMMKLYRPQDAEKEFIAQQKAYDALKKDKQLQGKVEVPQCYFSGEMTVDSPTLKEKLQQAGIDLRQDKFGMILMDYVPGEDLGAFCYKSFIKMNFERFMQLQGGAREVEPEEQDNYLRGKGIDELIGICHDILGVKAKYQYFDNSSEARSERNQIATMILSAIENRGLFDKEKIASLRRAMETLHESGIYHRDMHLRNVIQDGEKMYLIDFGSARIIDPESEVEKAGAYHSDEGIVMQDDEAILSFLSKLARTPEEIEAEKTAQTLNLSLKIKNIALMGAIKAKPGAQEKRVVGAWQKLASQAGEQELTVGLRGFCNDLGEFIENDRYFDYWIAGLMLIDEIGQSRKVAEYVKSAQNDENTKPILLSKLNALSKIL